jgi:thiol-disulfide isomerase/thioredoxin
MSFIFFVCILSQSVIAGEAPNVPLYDLKGNRYIFYLLLNALPTGGVAILNFTSVYCLPCKKEIPELRAIADKACNVKLLCIYAEEAAIAGPHAKKMGIYDYSYVDALGAVQGKFGVKKYPATILINKKREIVGRFEGYTVENIEAIKRIVTLR